MTRLRLSVSKLENYLMLCAGLDWYSYDRFRDDLDPSKREANEAMDVGNMVHDLAEWAKDLDIEHCKAKERVWSYEGECVEGDIVGCPPVTYWLDLDTESGRSFVLHCQRGNGVAELPIDRIEDTPTGPVRVTGRVDVLDGNTVTDYKAKIGKAPDHVARSESWQWRNYLWLTGASVFTYCEVKLGRVRGRANTFRIDSWEECHNFRYTDMDADCRRWLADAASFIRSRPELEALCIDTETEIG